MGDTTGDPEHGEPPRPEPDGHHKVSMVALVFLTFYEVSGGPFGIEDSVRAAGPLLALLGFLLFPFLWSIPEALMTAEMGTMYPEDAGFVVWVASAFGPFWGFQVGWIKWVSGFIDNALYPVLILDYLNSDFHFLGGGLPRVLSVVVLTVVLTYVNYRGMSIVGGFAVFLGVFSILPFIVMGLVAIPKLEPSRWLVSDLHDVDMRLYLNTLFWNLNHWDSISTLVGEVQDPGRNLPKALGYTIILVILSYVYPLLAGTGAVELNRGSWRDGYFSDVAQGIAGGWLRWWVQVASAFSNMGMFVAALSSNAYQLLGMAERRMIPAIFAKRSRHQTPTVGILLTASGVLMFSWMSFQEIVEFQNYLYCVSMLMEFAAFARLRWMRPAAERPYRVPMGMVGSFAMLMFPNALVGMVLVLAGWRVVVGSVAAVAVGLVVEPCLRHAEKRGLVEFCENSELPDVKEGEEERKKPLLG